MLIQSIRISVTNLTLLTLISLNLQLPVFAQNQPRTSPSNQTPNSGALPQLDSTYNLGTGDRLRLDVFGVDKYSGEYLVLTDGTVNLPGIGTVEVRGLTLPQAQARISQRYSALLKQPVITLSLIEFRPVQIAISGEVNRPGSYRMAGVAGQAGGGDGQLPRVTQAIQLAGGLTKAADLNRVQLRRVTPNGSVVTLNLEELIEEGNLNQDPILLDGDSIYIPTAVTIESAQIRQIVSSGLVSPENEPLQVVVVGEVFRPGVYTVSAENDNSDPPTVTRAIQIAGGITNSADIRNVEVRRITRNGLQTTEINLWELLQSGDINQDPFLQEGDTIVIPQASEINPAEVEALATASFAPATINVNVVGEVVDPGILEVPPNTPLNQAILAAGGFDSVRARKKEVELIRINPDGTATREKIIIDLAEGINNQNNPLLRNNDIVVVSRTGLTRFGDLTSEFFRPVRDIITLSAFLRLFGGN
ncbi:SLBB domain-containing protein [Capilliphycus salinus ALCB114379]|uniref:SLBB domain-containing protein n=1 Tax=Capilliphycus salinus TaxID=2768948 RepID=UPI0039A74BBF